MENGSPIAVQLAVHEAVCGERWKNFSDQITGVDRRLDRIEKWLVGAAISAATTGLSALMIIVYDVVKSGGLA